MLFRILHGNLEIMKMEMTETENRDAGEEEQVSLQFDLVARSKGRDARRP